MPVGEKFCYTYKHTHIDACVSLCVCVCVAECKRQYVARYKTTYRPQSEAHKHSQTHIRAHSLTHTRTYGSSQNAQAKIAANYMRLQSSTAQQSHWAFRSHILLAVAAAAIAVVVFIACCFRRQSAAQLFLCRFFSIALTFGSVLGKSFAVFSSPRFYIPIQRHTRSLFCFAAAAATTSCPQITPHPPRQQRQNVNNNSTIP